MANTTKMVNIRRLASGMMNEAHHFEGNAEAAVDVNGYLFVVHGDNNWNLRLLHD